MDLFVSGPTVIVPPPMDIMAISLSILISILGDLSAAPQLKLAVTELDLGEIQFGEMVKRAVRIENAGDEELEITEVSTSCSLCSSVAIKQRVLAPFQETELAVTFRPTNPGSRKKPQQIEVTVRSNDPKQPKAAIKVWAMVLPIERKETPIPQLLRLALRGRQLSTEQWVEVIQALPGEPTATHPELKELVSQWHQGPSFTAIPADGSIPASENYEARSSGALIHSALAKRLAEGAPRLARLLAMDLPEISEETEEILRTALTSVKGEVRSTLLLVLAELEWSRGRLPEAARLYEKLIETEDFPRSVWAVEGQYPPYSSDPGWHAARRVWRLAQLNWLLGKNDECLEMAKKGLTAFHGTRWIRWVDILLPLGSHWKAAGKRDKAKEIYVLAKERIPISHENRTAEKQFQIIQRDESIEQVIQEAEETLKDSLLEAEE